MQKIKCNTCNTEFYPSKMQEKEIKEAAKAGIQRFIINCPNCHSIVFVFPLKLLGLSDEIPKEIEDNRLFHCPIAGCTGFVEEDKNAHVFGSSECGAEWRNLKEVYADIEKIIKKYPYRKEVYIKDGKGWKSLPFDKTPKDYYEKVQKEKI